MTEVGDDRRVEDAATRLNRSLLTLSRCNRVLWQASTEQTLLQSICQILVETAGARLVWIGYCEDDAEQTVRPVASAGNGQEYLEHVKISWGNSDAGQGPVGDAIRTGKFCWVDDIRTDKRFSHRRTEATALGYVSCLAFPLVADAGAQGLLDLHGTFTLYADAFDKNDIERYADLASYLTCAVARLRSNLADDVSYGVAALRTREDRRRAHEALRERAQLLDLSHDAIFVRDVNNVITYWNRGAEELYGWKQEEALGKVTRELLHTVFVEPLEQMMATATRTGHWEGELIHTKRDGTQVVVASRWSVQRNEQGRVVGMLVSNNDITERKRAEKSLQRQANLLEQTHDAILVWGSPGGIIYWNRGAEQLYGYSREEAMGRHSHDLLLTEHPMPAELFEAIVEREGSWVGELTHRTREGRKVVVDSRQVLLREADGRRLVLETNRDVTERKRAEYLTGQVFESSPDGLCITDRDYRIQRANPAYQRFWGVPAERIVGMPVADLVGREEFEQRAKMNLDRCFAGEEVSFADWFATHRGRTYRALSYSPLRPNPERVEAALLIARDLTDHMQASEALREAQAELARVTRLTTMGQLAASIAHEVNQPLTGVISNGHTCLHWLEDETLDLAKARVAAQRVVRDGQRASGVIGRIRGLMTKSEPQVTEIDLNGIITEVLALAQTELRMRRVSVDTELAAALPPVLGDQVQLQQVLLNLVLNGIDAMVPVNDRPRRLLIGSRLETGGDALVFVRDHGTGLDPDTADKIFNAFFTTKAKGMGMGLAICRSIVEAHGGRLWASPASPHGAVFQFTVPTKAAGQS